MQYKKTVYSAIDSTVKYVFLTNGQTVDFSYINKNDGKDIICVPTQTHCVLGCKFCHLTGLERRVWNLTSEEIVEGVNYLVQDLHLEGGRDRTLLISYMGAGEPLLNVEAVIHSAKAIVECYQEAYGTVRFAVASLIPSPTAAMRFSALTKKEHLNIKLHWSLHSPLNSVRHLWMPAACPIDDGLRAVRTYMNETGNNAELHYALIQGENDRVSDAEKLSKLFGSGEKPTVKLLSYNPKEGLSFSRSQRLTEFRRALAMRGVTTEYYQPPGSDIGASCGQFCIEDDETLV
jgi:adenine C2-methylase RlmN of 23S rRNA A2503 and tRNA A37